jgi:hypothetical protein
MDSSANQGVLVTPDGTRVLIQATGSDGSLVKCVTPVSIATVKNDSPDSPEEKSQVIVGKTDKGSAGIWIYTSAGKFKPVEHDGSGHNSNRLPESDDHKGDIRSTFGWTYNVVDISEDGKIVVGYAENKDGVKIGHVTVDPGTKVGVYWRIWSRDSKGHMHPRVSTARIIGTLDTSAFHSNRRGHHRWLGYRLRRVLERLKLFLLNYYSDYLTAVEKKLENNTKAIHYDSSKMVYEISGTDQDGQDAIATLDPNGKITIQSASPTTTSVDLAAGLLTVSQSDLMDSGATVNGTLVLKNVGTSDYSGAIPVDFYVSPSSAFTTSGATANATTSYTETISAGAEATVNFSFAMPILGANADQAVYIYANVDPANTSGDIDVANNLSTAANAGVILVYSGSGSYNLSFNTYDPQTGTTGSLSGGTLLTNTMIALYKDNGSGATYVGSDIIASDNYYGNFSVSGLTAGTYYVVVLVASPGPYALNVRSSNIALNTFTPLSAAPTTSNEIMNPGMYTVIQNKTALTGLPVTPEPIKVGNALNWYGASSGDCDWFTFTLH